MSKVLQTAMLQAVTDFAAENAALRAKLASAQARIVELEGNAPRVEKATGALLQMHDAANRRIAELEAEYRSLWDAGIAFANSPGNIDELDEEAYTGLVNALMRTHYWDESCAADVVANAAPPVA